MLAVGAAFAPASHAAVPPAYYDPSLGALVVPYPDRLPSLNVQALDNPPRIFIDFTGAPNMSRSASGQVSGQPTLVGWAMAPQPGGRMRLTLTFRRQAGLALHDDPAGHRLLLVPLLDAPPTITPVAEASPTPGASSAPSPRPTPAAATRAPLPIVSFIPWVASLAASATPKPAPAPSSRARSTPVPALPSLEPISAPEPEAVASREPAASAQLRADVFLTSYAERYALGQVDTQVAGVRMQGVECEGHWPASWVELLRLDAASYAFQDLNLPSSAHVRDAWRGEAALLYHLGWGGLALDLGPGYALRYETASHTGAPPTPIYAFASARLLHGPELAARLRWQVGWGFGLFADAAATPYVFSTIDDDLAPLPSLWAYRAEAGLEQAIGPVSVGLAFRQRAMTGTGYEESYTGPGLWLGIRGAWP
ncbi:MAG: hypothetical protein JWM80_5534 [Cyanobacteria bacterium RYN_339]|nr:hypothetical protein [Cyanobacteria bacterium RYN_339]